MENERHGIAMSKGSSLKRSLPQACGEFVILNEKGLHTRPSTEFVRCATKFRAQIMLTYQGCQVNGKSLLNLLTLAATKGARLTIDATGEDAQEAVEALISLAENKFFTDY